MSQTLICKISFSLQPEDISNLKILLEQNYKFEISPSVCKDKENRKFEFVAGNQFHCYNLKEMLIVHKEINFN